LLKFREIALATIDYLLAGFKSELDDETFGHVRSDFEKQKRQIQTCWRKGQLKLLNKKLNDLLDSPTFRCDLLFSKYVHEKTGYHIDIFKNVKKRVDTILRKGVIEHEKELWDVGILLTLYNNDVKKIKKADALKSLIIEFGKTSISRNKYTETIAYSVSPENDLVKITKQISTDKRGDIHEVTGTEILKRKPV